jgi:ureidoglycolate dehydrogenase (NAD+)
MRIKIEEVEKQLAMAASKYVSKAEASYFAGSYVETHLRKAPRMMPIQEAVADLKVWKDHHDKPVKSIVDKKSIMVLDFNGLAPSLKIKQIHDEIEKRARESGIAALGFRNSSGITTLNMWSSGLAKRDMIGICMFNGGTECSVPYGGRHGVMGTNPIAYAIPTATHPIILDMATTEIPYFEIKNAKEKKVPLKPNVALNQNGKPTTDAGKALNDDGIANLLPMGGGFKGYGILMLIEILTGPLVRSLLSTQQTSGWNPPEYGFLMIAIDISSFVDPTSFKQDVSEMCAKIRSLQPADGFDAVQIPGDRGHAKQEQAMASGEIDIEEAIIEDLRLLAC